MRHRVAPVHKDAKGQEPLNRRRQIGGDSDMAGRLEPGTIAVKRGMSDLAIRNLFIIPTIVSCTHYLHDGATQSTDSSPPDSPKGYLTSRDSAAHHITHRVHSTRPSSPLRQ